MPQDNVIHLPPNLAVGKNKRPRATYENFRELIRSQGITIRYNEIRKEVDITIPNRKFLPDNYLNCCVAELCSLCEANEIATGHLLKFITMAGDENKINPVAEWIESIIWDGESRLEKFYETITSTNEEFKKILLKRWMISCIAALYEPLGVSAGGMLVLCGAQYKGKTNWFKNLVPEDMRQFIQDGMSVDPHNRDSFMLCLENWLIELGEIDSTFKRADLAALKAFITRQRDTARLSYAAANSRFPRRTVFMGSVDKKEYLRDPAGNRRFWTVECEEINHTHGLDMQQVWAEIAVLYHDHEPWLLTKDEHILLTGHNEEFEITDPMKEKILEHFDWGFSPSQWMTATQILESMGYKNINHADATNCGRVIRKLNGNVSKHDSTGSKRLLYVPAPVYRSTLL